MIEEQHTADPVPGPTARLEAAATHLRQLLAAIATESPADLPLHADGRTVTQGRVGLHDFATAATPEVARFIRAMGPSVGLVLAEWLERAAHSHQATLTAAGKTWASVVDPRAVAWIEHMTDTRALAVADAILAGVEQ